MPDNDTIFALATSAQPAPVALVRVSGAGVGAVCRALIDAPLVRASLECRVILPVGEVPCRAWVLPAPRTLTGDDTLELRVPGNPAIIRQLAARLKELGCRDAEPGEFTRRALNAGKLDLSRAQAIMQLVTATDETARRQAAADLTGETAAAVRTLAEHLRALSARLEMSFDFSEEEHADAAEDTLPGDVAAAAAELAELAGRPEAPPQRDKPVVALFGPPNAGKSSLFNALLGVPRALVSPTPGTTRDAIEAAVRLGEHEATMIDLSGVGETDQDLGRYSDTALERAMQADILLALEAPSQRCEAEAAFAALESRDASVRARALWVHTMADVAPPELRPGGVAVSAFSGGGLDALRDELAARLAQVASGEATSLLRRNVREASALLSGHPARPNEALASDVRRALVLLDEALLSETPGDVLDLIFSRFCIGK